MNQVCSICNKPVDAFCDEHWRQPVVLSWGAPGNLEGAVYCGGCITKKLNKMDKMARMLDRWNAFAPAWLKKLVYSKTRTPVRK